MGDFESTMLSIIIRAPIEAVSSLRYSIVSGTYIISAKPRHSVSPFFFFFFKSTGNDGIPYTMEVPLGYGTMVGLEDVENG